MRTRVIINDTLTLTLALTLALALTLTLTLTLTLILTLTLTLTLTPTPNDADTGPQALSLQLSLLGLALLVQSARFSASRTDATASLFTLCFHSIFVGGFWISTRGAPRGDYVGK